MILIQRAVRPSGEIIGTRLMPSAKKPKKDFKISIKEEIN
jgi:hypothetical protein